MYRFQQLLDLRASIPWHYGETFYASAVALVPRASWESKPVGFGKELSDLFGPELRNAGHSELALLHGEMFWNFGLMGVALFIPAYGWSINRLARFATTHDGSGVDSMAQLLRLVLGIVLVASIVDLVWGGTFTYVSRVLPRLGVLVVLMFSVTQVTRRRERLGTVRLRESGERLRPEGALYDAANAGVPVATRVAAQPHEHGEDEPRTNFGLP